jgi:tetratricopeptide (TPR) repeat protein
MQMTRCRALAAASTGRLSEARLLWAEAAGAAAHVGSPAWQADIKVMEAVTEALLGDARRARAAADAALALDQHPSTVLFTAIALASSGDHARAGTLLDSVADRDDGALSLKPVWLSIARALVEAESGRPERARQVLGPAAPFERSRDFALAPLGIRASLELSLGRSREAAATYRELLRLRGAVSMSPWIPAARLGLARALRDQGDLPGSRAAYQAVLDSMKEADADAPLLVAARRELDALAAR